MVDVFGVVGIGFDLLAQIADEHAQVVHLVAIVGTPDRLQKLAMGHGFIGMAGEIADQIQLLGREVAGADAVEDRSRRQNR